MSDYDNIFSESMITELTKATIKIERDCFYGDQASRQRKQKVRDLIERTFEEYQHAREKDS